VSKTGSTVGGEVAFFPPLAHRTEQLANPLTGRDPESRDIASGEGDCTGVSAAPSNTGLNTLLPSASTTPVPDIVALAATAQNDGILHITGTMGSNAFAVTTVNVGASAARRGRRHPPRYSHRPETSATSHNSPIGAISPSIE
jgi:hypothetical protein